MQTATARPLSLPRPVETESLVPSAHVHDAIARAESLERDLKAARVRLRTLTRALNDGVRVGEPIATARALSLVGKFIQAANIAELMGESPAVRFSRNADGVIDGLSLALLVRDDDDAPLYLADAPVAFGGMAVVE